MTNIILVRHGETQWNVDEVFRGRMDVGLNETGIRQAALLAEYLSRSAIDAIYSSPLKRASKTAEMMAEYHQLKVEITADLIDLDYGEWQGLPHQEVKDRYHALYTEWINRPDKIKMPSGESLNDVRQRASGVVDKVIAQYDGTVLLVSHRVVNKVLICALLGLDNSHFWNIRQDTCGITIFAYENRQFVLTRHNDTSYLKPVPKASFRDF